MQIVELDHPLARLRLTDLRDRDTDPFGFRSALAELTTMLVYEAARDLPVTPAQVLTPVGPAAGAHVAEVPLLVPVLRAGLGMVDAAQRILGAADVGLVGLARDEQTLEPFSYLESLPDDLRGRPVLILDPMLATGGSLVRTAALLAARGADRVCAVCVVAAPAGVAALRDCRDVDTLVVAAVDEGLNADAYIVPGLGDAGDRQFGPLR